MSKANDSKESLSELVTTLNLIKAQSNAILQNGLISRNTHSQVVSNIQSVNSLIDDISKKVDEGKAIPTEELSQYVKILDKFSASTEETLENYRSDITTIKTVNKNKKNITTEMKELSKAKSNLIRSGVPRNSDDVKKIDQAITTSSNNLKGAVAASKDAEQRRPYHKEKFRRLYKNQLDGVLEEMKQDLQVDFSNHQVLSENQKNVNESVSKPKNNMKGQSEIKSARESNVKRGKEKRSIKWDETTIEVKDENLKKEPYLKLKPAEQEKLAAAIEKNRSEAGPLKDLEGKELDIKAQLAKQPVKSILKTPSSNHKDKVSTLKNNAKEIVKNVKKFFDHNLSDLIKKPEGQELNKSKTVKKSTTFKPKNGQSR